MKKPKTASAGEWPSNKPLPAFDSPEEEDRFWGSHSFADAMEDGGEELVYEPQATRRPRTRVYRVRLTDDELAILQSMAKRLGVTGSVILRDFLRRQGSTRIGGGIIAGEPGRGASTRTRTRGGK